MIESGVKILGLDIIADLDGIYFPAETVAEGTGRISWDALKADLLGGYELWPHDIPGTTNEIVSLRNASGVDVFTILELRAPENSATLETTLSMHCYSAALGQDWVRDLSLHNYSGSMRGIDVLSNFTDETYADWKWVMNVMLGGVLTETTPMRLYGETGNLIIAGSFKPAGGYLSADDSAGVSGTFTSANGKTITIKNGIVTSIV